MTFCDYILIGVIFILSASWLVHSEKQAFGNGGTAFVYEDGRSVEKINVKEDKIIELPLAKGKMDIEVNAGRIRISDSSCSHQVCVNSGWTSRAHRTIVCVPNKVLIEIKSENDPGYHALAY
jgi:hypothetical protein